MKPREILISKCLIGAACRFDGKGKQYAITKILSGLVQDGAATVCPEEEGGLGTPRDPAEITVGNAADVLDGKGRVTTIHGRDVTEQYLAGAEKALEIAMEKGIKLAILKERSPSCSCSEIYDGSFSQKRIAGNGITTEMLRRNGVRVINEEDKLLRKLINPSDEHCPE